MSFLQLLPRVEVSCASFMCYHRAHIHRCQHRCLIIHHYLVNLINTSLQYMVTKKTKQRYAYSVVVHFIQCNLYSLPRHTWILHIFQSQFPCTFFTPFLLWCFKFLTPCYLSFFTLFCCSPWRLLPTFLLSSSLPLSLTVEVAGERQEQHSTRS